MIDLTAYFRLHFGPIQRIDVLLLLGCYVADCFCVTGGTEMMHRDGESCAGVACGSGRMTPSESFW
jgi:hypothetical protein